MTQERAQASSGQTVHGTQHHHGFDLLQILHVVATHLRALVLLPLALGVLAFLACLLLTPKFTAVTQILPPQQQQSAAASMLQSLGALSGLAGAATGIKNPADQYVEFLRARSVEDSLVERFELKARYGVRLEQEARKILRKRSSIAATKSNLIKIEFDDPDPQFAAALANGYAEELGHLLNRLAVTEAQQRRMFFEGQLRQAKDNLIKAEQVLAASGVSVAAINANPAAALEGPARLRAEITALEVRLSAMGSYLTRSAPEFVQAQAQLDAMRAQLEQAEQQQPSSDKSDYIAKYREFKYQETLFELFSKQYEMAKLDESREGATIQVVDYAEVPERKSKPRKLMIAVITSLVSALALLTWIFLQQSLQRPHEQETSQKLAEIRAAVRHALRLRR